MGSSSRRRLQRFRYGGLGYNYHPPETAGSDADASQPPAPSPEDAAPEGDELEPVIAPVLDLDGLEPWAEIRGPALALEEETDGGDEPVAVCDDPAQLALGALRETVVADGAPVAAETSRAPSESVAAPPSPPPPPRPDPLELLFAEARAAADAGRGAEAKRICREVLAQRPSHVRARNEIARLLESEGNQQAALAELDQALDVEPEDCGLLLTRGALLGAMGRYAAAERDLKKLLRVEPSHPEALFHLGVVLSKKGLWGEAVPHLQRAVELEPSRGAAHYYLGEALNHVDDLQGALRSYQRAAELQPDNPRALYGLGIIYDRLARPDDAANMYRRSREVGRR